MEQNSEININTNDNDTKEDLDMKVNQKKQKSSKPLIINISNINILGIIGSLITIISVCLPFASATFFGTSVTYRYIDGDGIFVIIIGIIAIIVSFLNKGIILIVLGVLDFLLFIYYSHSINSLLNSNLSKSYFNMSNLLAKGAGYYLMPVGAILMICAGIYYILKRRGLIIINGVNKKAENINKNEIGTNNILNTDNKELNENTNIPDDTKNTVIENTKNEEKHINKNINEGVKDIKEKLVLNKKKLIKIGIGVIAVIVLVFLVTFIISLKNPGRFEKRGDQVIYKFRNGHYARNEWVTHDGEDYYFDSDGVKVVNRWVDTDYFVDLDGKKLKGQFIEDNGKHYYLKEDGKYAKNELLDIGGKTYAFIKDGENIRNAMWPNASPSYICYVNSDGYIEKQKGYMDADGETIYIKDDNTGALIASEWLKDEDTGKYYYFDDNGWMVKNKIILEKDDNGQKSYKVDPFNSYDSELENIASIAVLNMVSGAGGDIKYYYVDENGIMLTDTKKLVNGSLWIIDDKGVAIKAEWGKHTYSDTHENYVKNDDQFPGYKENSLSDDVAYLTLAVDSDDITFFLYEGKNKRQIKNSMIYTEVKYRMSLMSKTIQNPYYFYGTMYTKGDRIVVDDGLSRTTIKNLLLSGENFVLCIEETDSYWDEKYVFGVNASNFATVYNNTFN